MEQDSLARRGVSRTVSKVIRSDEEGCNMLMYTRMGFLVPLFWVGSLATADHVVTNYSLQPFEHLSHVFQRFLLGAILTAILCYVVGKILNRVKFEQTIYRFGKQKIVCWGEHTFYMLPMEYWGLIILFVTLIVWGVHQFV